LIATINFALNDNGQAYREQSLLSRISLCLLLLSDVVLGRVYCLTESFIAQCLPREIIIVESAVFGRMQIGRCVAKNYGHLGCSVDVLYYLDAACSGLNSCELSVSDPVLVRTRPCPPDFASYLDASYQCVPGIGPTHHI